MNAPAVRTTAPRLRQQLRQQVGDSAIVGHLRRRPRRTAFVLIVSPVAALVALYGVHDVAQTGLYGLSLGSVYALGAVGLTLVYGILKLVNFAHGEFLTFGAYMAFAVNVSLGLPIIVAALSALVLTALLGLMFERLIWGPMRRRGAGMLQLLIMSIGVAFIIRYTIQLFAGSSVQRLAIDRTNAVELFGLRLGTAELVAIIVGFLVLVIVGLVLKLTLLGKHMRAISDDLTLAETAGIDTSRVILYTWLLAGAAAGLGGVLASAVIDVRPELGFELLLPIFAAVIIGGIGDAFGALIGGVAIGLMIEWSTLVIEPRFKIIVGFAVLVVVLVVRPQGIFGRARTV